MKRVLCSVLLIAVLMTAMLIPVSAATNYYSYDYTFEMLPSYSSYAYRLPDDTDGEVYVMYFSGTASTSVDVPTGGSGWTHTGIFYHAAEGRRGSSDTVVDGIIRSEASLEWYPYASRATHSGNMTAGDYGIAWDYAFQDPDHRVQ